MNRSSVALVAALIVPLAPLCMAQNETVEHAAPADARWPHPPYADLNAFDEREVIVDPEGVALPGTLSMPDGSGPHPAVVLVHGSGPNDRDETIGLNKPFRDLAFGLASRGVAVLRYEKRTRVNPGSLPEDFTLAHETIDDAVAAARLLRESPGIDPQRVFILGHSLGGMAAPRILQADDAIAGAVIMAGPTRPLEDLIVDQMRYMFELDGQVTPEEEKGLELWKRIADQIRSIKNEVDPTEPEVAPGDAGDGTGRKSGRPRLLGAPASYWRDLRDYNPAALAATLDRPLLILQGGRDYQITVEEDLTGWRERLANHRDVEFHVYPKLNHLFIEGDRTSNPGEYFTKAGHVDEAVVVDIARWIHDQKTGER